MRNTMNEGTGYRIFQTFNTLFFLLVIFMMAYPIFYVLICSISDPGALARNHGVLWVPLKPYTLAAYQKVFANRLVLSGYKNTLVILLAGLAVNLSMTSLGAYFLSLKDVMFRKPVTLMVIFTMYFSGGMIPAYLNIKTLGLMDSVWSLILPGAIGTYNMLILRSAFSSVPDSLVEAAKLDGASHLRILLDVMLPLSGATMAVLVLYYGVGHWNSWFNASIYLNSSGKYPLALVLRNILIENSDRDMMAGIDAGGMQEFRSLIKYALIIVSTAPIMLLYPFLQRFFVKGVLIGAIKG